MASSRKSAASPGRSTRSGASSGSRAGSRSGSRAASESTAKSDPRARTASRSKSDSGSKTNPRGGGAAPRAKSGSASKAGAAARSGSGAKSASTRGAGGAGTSYVITDHDEIRRWAEERGGRPARVIGTGGKGDDVGMIRIDFPGFSGEGTLEPISWDEFFKAFDENNLALVVQEETKSGRKSRFNKLVSRDRVAGDAGGAQRAGGRGRTREDKPGRSAR